MKDINQECFAHLLNFGKYRRKKREGERQTRCGSIDVGSIVRPSPIIGHRLLGK
jgi:hypothetical protein